MIVKLVGIFAVGMSGIFAASALRTSSLQRLSRVEGILELVRFIRSQIDCFAKPLPRILCEVPKNIYEQCGYRGESLPTELSELALNCDISDAQTRKIFVGICSELGKGYIREQLRCCDYYLELLEQKRDMLAASLPSRLRAQSAVCIAAALGVIIILF